MTFMHIPRLHLCFALIGGVFFATAALTEEDPVYQLTDGNTVAPLELFKECDACPEMIVIPLGSFMMGAIEGESRNPFDLYGPDATGRVRGPDEINIIPNEHPRHRVEIDIPFAMGRNEVTHAEWMICVVDGGCSHNPDHRVFTLGGYIDLGPNHPAVNVSFLDAQEYVSWLNEKVGAEVYRLPTEAEWEYAARAGTTTRFAQGDELTANQANFSRGATEHVRQQMRTGPMTHLVNRRAPVPVEELDAANGWGLRHMSGNIYEVTSSCWTDTHIGLSTSSAYWAEFVSSQPCERLVGKGGAFTTAMDGLRLARRTRPKETSRRSFRGFRVLRVLQGGIT